MYISHQLISGSVGGRFCFRYCKHLNFSRYNIPILPKTKFSFTIDELMLRQHLKGSSLLSLYGILVDLLVPEICVLCV